MFGFGVRRSTLREQDFNGVGDSVASIQGAAFFSVPAPLDAFIMHKLCRWLQQVCFQNYTDPPAPFKMINALNTECGKHTLSGITRPKCNKMNWFARLFHIRRGVKDYAVQMWDSAVFNHHGIVMFWGFLNLICRKKCNFKNVWGKTNPIALKQVGCSKPYCGMVTLSVVKVEVEVFISRDAWTCNRRPANDAATVTMWLQRCWLVLKCLRWGRTGADKRLPASPRQRPLS